MLSRASWNALWRDGRFDNDEGWCGVAGIDSSVTVVSFVMRGGSSRVERRQKRSEERAAGFRVRRRGHVADTFDFAAE